jgi:RNA polymerase sigma-70 factor, ECF subfamily
MVTSEESETGGDAHAEVTELLRAWRTGDADAGERLMRALYHELHEMARRRMIRERSDGTLQTTALVHEAYLRMIDQRQVDFRDRGHFLALAATMMRRVLIDRARARSADKRGAGAVGEPLTDVGEVPGGALDPAVEILDIDRVLERLAETYPRPARVVELRFFGGLEFEEIGTVLEMTERTARRDWVFARTWLERALGDLRPKGA